ncbi:MAG: cupin domain-containing protein [Gemmatimonadetes bacterium]|nr:cupin domain-containing protein [Gemmatimonadota bacterium]
MKVVRIDRVPKERVVSPLFTSREVYAQPLSPEGGEFNSRVITFGKGVRNKFHAHESDQILIVTAGRGLVATEGEQREVTVGDVIFFAAGEKHWHGATPDSDFSHIYVHLAKAKSTQLED